MKEPKPKKINFQIIPDSHESYKLMEKVRKKYHDQLDEARIAIAWRIALKPDKDGHLILGKCMKASDLQRELVDYDFVILLNREVWREWDQHTEKKLALLDHELCHAEVVLDKMFEPKRDEKGRKIWRTRKHDIEEFKAVVERHGLYKSDLEQFAKTCLDKAKNPLLAGLAADSPKPKEKAMQ